MPPRRRGLSQEHDLREGGYIEEQKKTKHTY